MRIPPSLLLSWLLLTTVSVGIGVAAVTSVGASVRARGPVGEPVSAGAVVPGSDLAPLDEERVGPGVSRAIAGDYGSFVVECRGTWAYGIAARPAPGWEVVSFEAGPGDDVDAEFRRGGDLVEVEVFCHRGRPTLAEIEHHTVDATAGTVRYDGRSRSDVDDVDDHDDHDDYSDHRDHDDD